MIRKIISAITPGDMLFHVLCSMISGAGIIMAINARDWFYLLLSCFIGAAFIASAIIYDTQKK